MCIFLLHHLAAKLTLGTRVAYWDGTVIRAPEKRTPKYALIMEHFLLPNLIMSITAGDIMFSVATIFLC